MQNEDDQWVCPSFNSYSSNGLAEIAAKVSDEVNGDVKFPEERLHSIAENDEYNDDNNDEEEEEEDFEFSLVREEIFYDGQVRPIFPIFNRDLLNDNGKSDGGVEENAIRIPLRNLFIEERVDREPPSSSEDESGEVESVPPGTYCVWKTKTLEQSPSRCKKSKSTGSGSKRPWKLRDLLRRSNSDGKDSFVFLTPKKKEEKSDKNEKKKSKGKAIAGGDKSSPFPSPSSSPFPSPSSSPIHDALFSRNRATKGNETPKRATAKGNETPKRATTKGNETPKRKTYLPYRQDLVGFFATVNTLGRTFPPF